MAGIVAPGASRSELLQPDIAVEKFDPHQRVGHRVLQAVDRYRLALQRLDGADLPGLQHRVAGRARDDRRELLDLARKCRGQGQPRIALHRRLEQHAEHAGRLFAHIEIGGPNLMRGSAGERCHGCAEGNQKAEEEEPVPGHRIDTSAAGCGSSCALTLVVELHPVFLAQPRKIVLAHLLFAFAPPLRDHLVAHRFERRLSGGLPRAHEHEVRAIAGLQRPAPFAGLDRQQRIGELVSEHVGDGLPVGMRHLRFKQEPVSEFRHIGAGISAQPGKHETSILGRILAVFRIEIDLGERQPRAVLETCRIRLEILAQLRVCRLGQPRRILDEEFQLLGQPAADDRIVFAETHGLRLAGKQLLVDEIGDQPLKLTGVRRPEPLAGVGFLQPLNLACADPHRLDAIRCGLLPFSHA